jgi:CubicO group peptidase (beta-lactamase class C family)
MNRRTLLLSSGAAALAACATGAAPPPTSASHPLADAFDEAANLALARVRDAPGIAVAVYTPDGIYARGFGVTDIETGERAHADTAFYIASSTKPLTALTLATLHERGELDLDQTLEAYAPDAGFPEATRPRDVTFRQLLSHTHGIQNEPLGFRVAFTGQHDPETLWRLLSTSAVNTDAPLGQFQYTNVGYNIATVLTDRKLGIAWQNLLQREIFGPAGMNRTSARMSSAESWSLAKPHGIDPASGVRRLYLEKTDQTMQSAGGVIMSANDAVRWVELMAETGRIGGRQLIPAAAIAATRMPLASVGATFNGYERQSYGLGWHIGPHRDQQLLHHFGGFAGFRAHVSYMPERRLGVAVFVNESDIVADVADAVANYVYDRLLSRGDAQQTFAAALDEVVTDRDRGMARVAQDRANRAARPWTLTRGFEAYAGTYENELWGRIDVSASARGLDVSYGVLHAGAEPFTRPDSMRLEFVPGMGVAAGFAGDGPRPDTLIFRGAPFTRV